MKRHLLRWQLLAMRLIAILAFISILYIRIVMDFPNLKFMHSILLLIVYALILIWLSIAKCYNDLEWSLLPDFAKRNSALMYRRLIVMMGPVTFFAIILLPYVAMWVRAYPKSAILNALIIFGVFVCEGGLAGLFLTRRKLLAVVKENIQFNNEDPKEYGIFN